VFFVKTLERRKMMPNIEIHGFLTDEARELREKIVRLFSEKPFASEIVITVFQSVAKDISDYRQPFLRVASTEADYVKEVLETLHTLEIDLEYMQLAKFIPGRVPKSKAKNP
jgi:hypothetical protein